MTQKINTYFAVLIITVIGSAAALTIVHFAYASDVSAAVFGSEAQYAALLHVSARAR